jgi:hypothetical protein
MPAALHPSDILIAIFGQLDARSLCSAMRVCRHWAGSGLPLLWRAPTARALRRLLRSRDAGGRLAYYASAVRHLRLGRGDGDVLRHDWAFPATALRRLEIDFDCLMRLPHRFVALLGESGNSGNSSGSSSSSGGGSGNCRSMLATVAIRNPRMALPQSSRTLERKSTLGHDVLAPLARLPWLSRLTVEAVLGRRIIAHALAAADGAASYARLEHAEVWLRASLVPLLVKLLRQPSPADNRLTQLVIHLSHNDGPVLSVIAAGLPALREFEVRFSAESMILAVDEIASLSALRELRSVRIHETPYLSEHIDATAFKNSDLISLVASLPNLCQLELSVVTGVEHKSFPGMRGWSKSPYFCRMQRI